MKWLTVSVCFLIPDERSDEISEEVRETIMDRIKGVWSNGSSTDLPPTDTIAAPLLSYSTWNHHARPEHGP